MFAIIEIGGTQYKVSKGDKIEVNRLAEKEGAAIKIDTVLLTSDGKKTDVGTPHLKATVSAKVVAHMRGEKIKVFKMKPKKRYHKEQGHRQELTELEITDIKA